MDASTLDQTPDAIVQRIDAIIRELEALRETITRTQDKRPTEHLAQELFGALGQGTWDEYDLDSDWQRFGS